MSGRAPLGAAAVLFAAGLLLPAGLRPPAAFAASLAGAALCGGIVACVRARRTQEPPRTPAIVSGGRNPRPHAGLVAAVLVSGSFFPLGLFASAAEEMSRSAHHVKRLLESERALFSSAIEVEGALAADARRRPPPEEGCSLEIALERIRTGRRSLHASGTVRVHVPLPPDGIADPCAPGAGARVRIAAEISAPRSFSNPGAIDYAAFLASRGIAATGRAPSARLVQVLASPGVLDRILTRSRREILASLDRAFTEGPGTADGPIAKALLLGVREGVPRDAERTLQRAGTSHLLAVSGFNVAVIAACVWAAARRLRTGPAARALMVGASLAAYLGLTGAEPSVVRAVLGALLQLAGMLAGRRADPFNTVSAVGVALLALHPSAVLDASFQLTFLAAAALAALAAPTSRALPGPRWLTGSIAVSVVALAATTPLTAYLFNRVTPGALAANLIASPLMAFALIAAAAVPAAELVSAGLGAIGVVFEPALAPARLIAWAASLAIEGALRTSAAVASTPGLTYLCPTPSGWLSASAVGAGALAALAGSTTRTRRAAALLSLALTLAIAWPEARGVLDARVGTAAGSRVRASEGAWPRSGLPGLRLTVFDVGQGSASLIETPGGKRLLVDGGGFARSAFDVGERVVGRALLSLGVRRLDAVAASHGDFDHAGGLPAILDMFDGGEFWLSAADHASGRLAGAARRALDRGRALRILAMGSRFEFGDATVEVLHPPREPAALSHNDRSLVLRLLAGSRSIVLTGDIESRGEEAVVPLLARSDVLVVPHHGSRTSSTSPFLGAARAPWAIISCGATNRWGHPHAEVLDRLGAHRVRVFRTDRDGAVRITLPERSGLAPGERRGGEIPAPPVLLEVFSEGGWRPRGDRAPARPGEPCPG